MSSSKRFETLPLIQERDSYLPTNYLELSFESNTAVEIGIRGIRKCLTIYRLKKYRDTGILRYFVTSSIVDNFCKNQKSNRANHLQCFR